MERLFQPLQFQPLFRRYLWGGRRLATILGKTLPAGDDYAESWELVDHGQDQSIVVDGPWQGHSLASLVQNQGAELLGQHHPQRQFPLLFKFLDAQQKLSLQVHPNDRQGSQLTPPDLGKTEAWVILSAEPGSCLYAGLKRGFDREAFERELRRGTAELCLHRWEPRKGDCIFVPAGTIHALGAGLVVAEVQQASNTTFRLFDWNRTGADGKPRELHLAQGLAVTDFDRGPVLPQTPSSTSIPQVEELVSCDKFVLRRAHLELPIEVPLMERCHILAILAGNIEIQAGNGVVRLKKGQTTLVPAACGSMTWTPIEGSRVELLDMYLPDAPIGRI